MEQKQRRRSSVSLSSTMAALSSSQLQHMLQSAVQAVHWTYSLFWKLCPQQGILVWGDGYYNGAIKTRKTVQAMEVSTEEASLQRSQQLRELYDSLSAEEANQPARRPSTALLPEDLTESEWFYLMSISFSFPPGIGLLGKAFTRQQHVWLTGANEADSKIFSRTILAKSAGVQTVVCIPLMDGIVELGTTENVQEDHGLIKLVKSFFIDHDHQHRPPNMVLSEQSMSNPTAMSDGSLFHYPPPLLSIYSEVGLPPNTNQEDDDDDDDDEAESKSDADTNRNSQESNAQNLLQLPNPITHGVDMAQTAAEPSELMHLEMSEDIRLGSPYDGSINLGPYQHMVVVSQSSSQVDSQLRTEPVCQWPSLQSQLSKGLQLQVLEAPEKEEMTHEDTHYSQTVSTILEYNSVRVSESSSSCYIGFSSSQSVFSKWICPNDNVRYPQSDGKSQWFLKYILFSVPFLYRDKNLSKSRYADMAIRLRKITSQDDLCGTGNHVLAERRRREKLNQRFIILRSLVPFVTKMDKTSILGDTIEYVKQLRRRIDDLEIRNQVISGDQRSKDGDALKTGSVKKHRSVNRKRGRTVEDRRKLRLVEGSGGGGRTKVVEGPPIVGNLVQVSIIECDALLELECLYREGLLVDIMQTLRDLPMEITAVQSSSKNGVFVAELRAKVKENSNGKKVTIVEVKRAIHQIISQY